MELLIQEHDKHPDSPYLFPSPLTGEMYHPDSVVNLHKKILKDAGLGHLRFHDLRHTFATTALQNGVDVKTVSSMLGHFDAGFTLRTYTHATRQKQDEAAQTMGNFMEQVCQTDEKKRQEAQTSCPTLLCRCFHSARGQRVGQVADLHFDPHGKCNLQQKTPEIRGFQFSGAAGRIRTADLILTKDALYLLSYSSIHAAHAALYSKRLSPICCNGDPERARTVDLQRDRLAF